MNDFYVQLNLKSNVLLQSLVRLKEPAVLLRCCKDDVHLVQSVLDSAKKEYASKVDVHPPEIFIDSVHLPPAASHHNAHGPFWYTLLILQKLKIRCSQLCYALLGIIISLDQPSFA